MRAVLQRRRIESAHMVLTEKTAARIDGKEALLELESGLHGLVRTNILIEGAFQRFDRAMRGVKIIAPDGQSLRPVGNDGMIETRTVLTPNDYISYMSTQMQGAAPNTVRTGPRNEAAPVESNCFDVRTMGLIPMPPSLWHSTPVEQFYGVAERLNSTVVREEVDGIATIKSSYSRADGKQVAIWVVPEMDHCALQAELKVPMRNLGLRIYRVRSALKEYAGQIWFPTSVEYTCRAGDEVVEHEVLTVDEAEFNIKVDPAAFTLAGLDVTPGAHVVGLPTNLAPTGVKVWDGEKLDDTESAKRSANRPPLQEGKSRSRLTWLIGINLGLGLIFLILYFRSRYRKSGNNQQDPVTPN